MAYTARYGLTASCCCCVAHQQALEELQLHKPRASTLRTWMKQPDGCFRSRAKSSLQGAGSGLMVRAHMLMASYQFTGCEQEWLSYQRSIGAEMQSSRAAMFASVTSLLAATPLDATMSRVKLMRSLLEQTWPDLHRVYECRVT